jgi:hypothetical protein
MSVSSPTLVLMAAHEHDRRIGDVFDYAFEGGPITRIECFPVTTVIKVFGPNPLGNRAISPGYRCVSCLF